jgi:prefoldin beta subunit
MANELPPKIQEQLEQLQKLQTQLAVTQQQRQQIEFQTRETERAMEELKAVADDAPVYRSVGGILFRTTGKTDVLTKLDEEKESLEVRLRGFQKQEGRIKENAQELQSKLQAALRNTPGFAPPSGARQAE